MIDLLDVLFLTVLALYVIGVVVVYFKGVGDK